MFIKTFLWLIKATSLQIVVVLCLASGIFAAPPVATISQTEASVSIPFIFDPLVERNIVVQIRIGDHKPLPFLIDTGLDASIIIDKWAAKELKLPDRGPTFTLNPGNNIGYVASPQDIALVGTGSGGNWIARQATVYVADLNSKTTLLGRNAGIIGISLLKAANLQIDFPRRQLLFLPLSDPLVVPARAIEIALRPDANPAFYDAILPDTPGLSNAPGGFPLLLDTGSDECLLPSTLVPDLHPVAATLAGQTTLAGSGTTTNWFIPSLKLGPITAENVMVGEASSTRGLLGLNVLSQFVVTLDWRGQRMWLTPTVTPSTPVPGATDVQLTEVKGHVLVDQVAPGSPAAQAGLRSKQKVLRVDGRDTDGVDGAEVELALAGYAGTVAKVTVDDSRGRHDIVFTRRSLSAPVSYPGAGLRLVHGERAHTGWYVQSLLCAAPAFQYGVRPGDVITAVGKTNIELMPLLAVEQLLRNAGATIQVSVLRSVTQSQTETTTLTPSETDPDLSKVPSDVREVIGKLLKEGWHITKLSNGTLSVMPPPKGDKPAANAGDIIGSGVDAQGKPDTQKNQP